MADMDFVTIELSKKQVDVSRLVHNDKTDKDYARVFAPGGGSFLYPVESIKVKQDNPERVYFSRPKGTEIQVQYGHRNEGVPDDAPNKEKYTNETRTWKIEDLKAAYDDERRAFAEKNNAWVNMTVPTEWGKHISNERGDFVAISIPIDRVYHSFIISEKAFHASDRDEGMSYFGIPKKKRDSEEDYTVTLRADIRNEDGSYEHPERVVTSSELKKFVDDAVEYANVANLFVSAVISEKLVRPFTAKESGKELCSVSVPIWEEAENKESFYEIVVPAERLKATEDGKERLSLFKKRPDGTEYVFTAKKSVSDGQGGYSDVEMKITSRQVVEAFNASKERFKESHQNNDRSLADELNASAQGQEQQNFRRHSGR